MRLLADENFPGDAVAVLRHLGHDVVWVKESAPATEDGEILAWAGRTARVLLTLDKDFGELAFSWGLPAECGIVLFRIPPIPARVAVAAEQLLRERSDFRGLFVVVEPWRIRERPMPR